MTGGGRGAAVIQQDEKEGLTGGWLLSAVRNEQYIISVGYCLAQTRIAVRHTHNGSGR